MFWNSHQGSASVYGHLTLANLNILLEPSFIKIIMKLQCKLEFPEMRKERRGGKRKNRGEGWVPNTSYGRGRDISGATQHKVDLFTLMSDARYFIKLCKNV